MTMHLARGLTMLNTKKPKRQITKAKLKRWAEDLRRYNKDMKRLGMHDHKMTMEQFIRNNRGIDDGKDLPKEFLEGIYEEIFSNLQSSTNLCTMRVSFNF